MRPGRRTKRFDSCVLRVGPAESARNIFLFSKDQIRIGKEESNEIVMKDIDYISGTHAVINVSRAGEFSHKGRRHGREREQKTALT